MVNVKLGPIAVGAQEGKSISVVGDSYRILVSGQETGGAFATIDMLIPPNGGPGPHAHPDFQETFYVIDGEIEVKSEAGIYTAKRGSYVVIPKGGMVHCFKNKTDTLAHLLCVVVPSGLEEFFVEIGKPVENNAFLPPPVLGQKDIEKLEKIAEKFGQKIYPPNYFDSSVPSAPVASP